MSDPTTKPVMRRVTCFMPEMLFAQVSAIAVSKGIAVSEVIRSSLDAYMTATLPPHDHK